MQHRTVAAIVDQIVSGQTEVYEQLAPEERRLLDTILDELKSAGRSPSLNALWESDFEIKPVTIDQFLEDDYYLGKLGVDIFPKWRDELRDVCDPKREVCEWVIRGCFVGDTKVKLLNGQDRTLKDWAENYPDEECHVYSYDNSVSKVSVGLGKKPRKTGEKIPCVRVTLDSGESEVVTPDHLFLMSNGRYKEAGLLQPGDSLMPLYTELDYKGYEHYVEPVTGSIVSTHDMVARWKYGQNFRAVRVEEGQPNVVHHMDFDKSNNDPSNLSVESRDRHLELHATRNKLVWSTRREELCKKISAGQQRRLEDEEFREFKARIGTTNLKNTPERSRERIQEYNATATPQQLSARARKGANTYWNDPELGNARRAVRSVQTSIRNLNGLSEYAHACRWTQEERERKRQETIEYNKNHHPNLRDDVTLDAICEALRVDPSITNEELRALLSCSMTKIYSVCKRNNLSLREVRSVVNHKVVSVEYAGDFDVYNIEVDDLKNYALSSGIFVHNCVGSGKTTVAVIALLHRIQFLCCLKNPQKYYHLMEGSPIVFGLFNIFKYLAQDTSYKYFTNWVKLSPFFQEIMRKAYSDERTVPGWLQRLNRMYGITNEEMANSYMRFPKGITLALGSNAIHALGQNLYGGLLDEADMSKNRSIKSDEKTKVEELYGQAKSRLDSRFLQLGGVNPGLLILVSQVQEADSFLSKHVEKVQKDQRTHISGFAIWEIKDHLFPPSEPRFKVVVGTRSYRSFVVDGERKIPSGARIIEVPESLRPRFEYSVDDAIRDQAGIPTYGANLFLPRRDKLFECYAKAVYREHPFTTDTVEISIDDQITITDYFVKEACMHQFDKATGRWRPKWFGGVERAIHVDLAATGDCAGMAMGCIGNVRRVQRYDKDGRPYWEQDYETFIDFALRIKAAQGSEIDFSKIRQFIFYLQSIGFPIKWFSCDGWQSRDTQQSMKKAGFDVKELSMDKKPIPYNYLRSAIYEVRLDMYDYEPFTDEITRLQDKTVEKAKPPIDHPPKGKKDVADCIGGVNARLAEIKDELRPQTTQDTIDERAELHADKTDVIERLQDPSWVTGGGYNKGNPLETFFKR